MLHHPPLKHLVGTVCLAMMLPTFSLADTQVGDFEGDFSAGPFGVWNPDHTAIDDDPSALAGLVSTGFLTDDPLTTASEGVTLNSQSLVLDHYQWQNDFKPYLSIDGGIDVAQSIIDSTAFSIDLTPILPAAGWEPGISFRQAFLAFSIGEDENNMFGKIQRDYIEDDNLNEFGEPQPATLTWNFSQFVGDDLNPLDVRTWKGWAQEAIDLGEEMEFFLIFQGRDVDETGTVIPFNPFNPTSVQVAVDNAQFLGLDVMPSIEGDFDMDGDVDGVDLGVFGFSFANSPQGGPPFADGDFDMDGDVDGVDLGVFGFNFVNFPPGASTSVPEPSSVLLACISLPLLRMWRARTED